MLYQTRNKNRKEKRRIRLLSARNERKRDESPKKLKLVSWVRLSVGFSKRFRGWVFWTCGGMRLIDRYIALDSHRPFNLLVPYFYEPTPLSSLQFIFGASEVDLVSVWGLTGDQCRTDNRFALHIMFHRAQGLSSIRRGVDEVVLLNCFLPDWYLDLSKKSGLRWNPYRNWTNKCVISTSECPFLLDSRIRHQLRSSAQTNL